MASVTTTQPKTVLTGLTNGTKYNVSVVARNKAGRSKPLTGSGTPRKVT